MKACHQCGQLDTHDAVYCSACGAKFVAETNSDSSADHPVPANSETAQAVELEVPLQPATDPTEVTAPDTSQEIVLVFDPGDSEQGGPIPAAPVSVEEIALDESEAELVEPIAAPPSVELSPEAPQPVEAPKAAEVPPSTEAPLSEQAPQPVEAPKPAEVPQSTEVQAPQPSEAPAPLDLRKRYPEKATEHDHLEFLLKEIAGWNQVSPALRRELRQPYENRLKALKKELGAPEIKPSLIESAKPATANFVTPVQQVAAVDQLVAQQHPPEIQILNAPPGVTGPLPANLNEARRERLARLAAQSQVPSNEPESTVPTPPSQRQLDLERAKQQQWEEAVYVPPTPPEPSQAEVLMADVNRLLQEQNIKGLHLLGGLLVAVSFFGFLGANWDGYGKTVAALTMTLSPIFFFFMAGWLRDKLPQGSRLMSVVGGILLPIGLITFNQFHIMGMNLPPQFWTPLSFLTSSAVILTLAKRFQEPVCLYLGALVGCLAGITAPAGGGFILSFGSFGSAGLCLWLAHQELLKEKQRPADSTEIVWSEHFKKLSTGLSSAGLLGGLIRSAVSIQSASTIFLVGSAYFTAQGYLSRSGNALLISALTGLMGAWGCQHLFKFSGPMLGLVSLLQGAMYLNRGRALSKSEDPVEQGLGAISYSLGVFLTGFVCLFSFGWTMFEGAFDHFASFSAAEKLTSIGTGVLATMYYAGAAYFYRRPQLVYAAAACCTYAYLIMVLLARQFSPEHYRMLFILLPLAWQALSISLRSFIPRAYLTPWVLTGTALMALLGPLQVLGQFAKPNPLDLWVDLGLAFIFTCGAVWTQRRELLAPAVTSMLMAYNTCVPMVSQAVGVTNLGLCYLPFIGVLAASSAFLSRFSPDLGRAKPEPVEGEAPSSEPYKFDFAAPLLHWAFGLALLACFSQTYYYMYSSTQAAITLGLYGLGFLAAAVVFKKSDFLGEANWEVFLSLALLNGLTSIAAFFRFDETGLLINTGLCSLLAAIGTRAYSRVKSLTLCGLLWAIVPMFHGLVLAGLKGSFPLSLQFAPFVWALPALLKPRFSPTTEEGQVAPVDALSWASMAAVLAGGVSLMVYETGLISHDAGLIQLLVMMALQLFICSWQDMGPLLAVSMALNVSCILQSTDGNLDQVRALSWLVSTAIYAVWGLRFASRLPKSGAWIHNCGAVYICTSALSLLVGGVWCNLLLLADALGLVAWSTAKGRIQDHQAGSILLFLALSALGYNLHWDSTIYAFVMSGVGFSYLLVSTRGLLTKNSFAQMGLIFTGVGYCTALMGSFSQGEMLCTLLLAVDSLAVLGWAMLRGGPNEHAAGSMLLLVAIIAVGVNLHWALFVYAYVLSAVGFAYLLVSSRFIILGQSFVTMGLLFAGLGYGAGLMSAVSQGDPRANALLLIDALLVVGWSAWRGRVSEHIAGTMLLLLGVTVLGFNEHWSSSLFSMVNTTIAITYLLLSAIKSKTAFSFQQMSLLFAGLGYCGGVLSDAYLPSMVLGGGYWIVRAWLTSKTPVLDEDNQASKSQSFLGTGPAGASNLHFAFLCGYTIWCRCGLAPDTIESYTMPIGFWIFGFSEFRKQTVDPAVALLIIPSTVASLAPGSGHAFYALAISLVVLAFGALRSRQRCITGGGAGLLAQVVIQAVFVAQQIPWYFSAVAVGLIVIGIALYLEKTKASRIHTLQSNQEEGE